jgi:hypothetical protein
MRALRGVADAFRRTRAQAESAVGQGLVELGLILAIAAIVAMVAVLVFGPQLAAILDFIGAQVEQPT